MIEQSVARMYPVPSEGQSLPPFNAGAHTVRKIVIDLSTARTGVQIKIGGNFLWMADASIASAALSIGFSREQGDDAIPYKLGTCVKGVKFDSIFVTNAAQAGVTATLIYIVEAAQALEVSNAGVTIATISLTKPTTAADIADANLANGASVTIAADSTRRRLVIQNKLSSTDFLRVGPGAAASRGIQIGPGQDMTFYTTAAIKIHNDSGAAQNYSWYSESD